jgi:hypothetical protein
MVPCNRIEHVYASPCQHFWGTCTSLARTLCHLTANGGAGRGSAPHQYGTHVDQVAAQLGAKLVSVVQHWPKRVKESPDAFLQIAHQALAELTKAGTVDLKNRFGTYLEAISQQVAYEQQASFSKWLMQATTAGASMAHGFVKQTLLDKQEMQQDGQVLLQQLHGITVDDRMQSRVQEWMPRWVATEDPQLLQAAWEDLKQAARKQEPFPPVSNGQLKATLKKAPTWKGLGCDQWQLRLWASLPPEAMDMLKSIVNGIEQSLLWPLQCLLTYIALIDKPDGGERPIGLTASLYKLVLNLRTTQFCEWEDGYVEFWDSAVKGSSPLQAAISRALSAEVATWVGLQSAGIYWDMTKFFDSILISKLIPLALQAGFPPRILYLAMQVHQGYRRFKEGNAVGPIMRPVGKSILAGCKTSVGLTRTLLYQTLERLHRDYKPVTLSTWVDDIAHTVHGPAQIIGAKLVDSAISLAESLTALGCTISTKTKVVCSTASLTDSVVQQLALRGLVLQGSEHARDLGVDTTQGKRYRRIPVLLARCAKARQKASVVKHLLKKCKQMRKIALTGVRPVIWGHQASGVSPTQLKKIRAMVIDSLGCRKPGGCATTALALNGYAKHDPLSTIRTDVVQAYIRAYTTSPLKLAIRYRWKEVLQHLTPIATRWKRAVGPLTGVIATLLDSCWVPTTADQWTDPQGVAWDLDFKSPLLFGGFKEIFCEQMHKQIWKDASQHTFGKGAELGIDFTAARLNLTKARKQADHRRAYWIEAVAQGSMQLLTNDLWVQGACHLCGEPISEQDVWPHLAWKCTRILNNQELVEVQTSNHLCQEACNELTAQPILWLRGLVPASETFGITAVQEEPFEIFCSHSQGELPFHIPERALLGTDGSGGMFSSDTRLRRCTWSVCVISSDLQLLFWAGGRLHGKQTVPASEVFAYCQALGLTTGGAQCVIDAKYLTNGLRKGSSHPHQTNAKHWSKVWQLSQARVDALEPVWFPSHLEDEDYIQGDFTPQQYLANDTADRIAAQMQSKAQCSDALVAAVKFHTGRSMIICKRLFAVALFVNLNRTGEDEPRIKPPPRPAKEEIVQRLVAISSHPFLQVALGRKCARCQLYLPKNATILQVQEILAVGCLSKPHLPDVQLYAPEPTPPYFGQDQQEDPQGTEDLLVFGRVLVHISHKMASQGPLKIWFCTACGAWGQHRSKYLRKPCGVSTPSMQQALKRILNGKKPG